jgi:hypothetical protein
MALPANGGLRGWSGLGALLNARKCVRQSMNGLTAKHWQLMSAIETTCFARETTAATLRKDRYFIPFIMPG